METIMLKISRANTYVIITNTRLQSEQPRVYIDVWTSNKIITYKSTRYMEKLW